jgi:hypothetical protein
MTIDATGKEIVIGNQYGYSKSSNGATWVVIGTAVKVNNGKVTLDDTVEKRYIYVSSGKQEAYNTKEGNRKRTIAAVQVFHVIK